MTGELDKPIGTKENPKLTAGPILVKEISVGEIPTKKGGRVKIVTFHCKHMDREELVSISNMKVKKVQGNNETITQDGIWYREDSDGNMDKNCRAAELCRFYQMETLGKFVNNTITTELNAAGYLAIKAY